MYIILDNKIGDFLGTLNSFGEKQNSNSSHFVGFSVISFNPTFKRGSKMRINLIHSSPDLPFRYVANTAYFFK